MVSLQGRISTFRDADCHPPTSGGMLLFNDVCDNMPPPSEYLKSRHCRSEHRSRALHVVPSSTGDDGGPSDLFPHESGRTEQTILTCRRHRKGEGKP